MLDNQQPARVGCLGMPPEAMRPTRVPAHYCGLPVMVDALKGERSGELQCPVCRVRYMPESVDLYVAHVGRRHPRLVRGGNAP